MKILILTSYTNEISHGGYGKCDYGDLCSENHLEYANKYGYSYLKQISNPTDYKDYNLTWIKINSIKNNLNTYDYVVWIDSDAIFKNMEIPLSDFIEDGVDLIIPKMEEDRFTGKVWTSVSTGFMIWKNSSWSHYILNKLWEDPGKYRYEYFQEQSRLDEILSEYYREFPNIKNKEKDDLESPIKINNIKILPYSYHRCYIDGDIKFIYHAGGDTKTKYSRICTSLKLNKKKKVTKNIINIITRVSRKEKFVEKFLPKLYEQTYENYHHIITYETKEVRDYIEPHLDMSKTTLCKVFPMKQIPNLYKSFYYKQHGVFDNVDTIDAQYSDGKNGQYPNWKGGRTQFIHFPYNLYMIRAEKKVKDGWVMYIDDDDYLYEKTTLEKLSVQLTDEDNLYFIKFNLSGVISPPDYALKHSAIGNEPPALGVGFISASIIFNSKYLEYTAWDEWSGSDWKTIQSLWYEIPNHSLIDQVVVEAPKSNNGRK